MPRIFVAVWAAHDEDSREGQWIDVDDADAIRRRIADRLHPQPQEGVRGWCVLAYDGLPDFGPSPNLDELLAYVDAVDEYGEAFERLWATRHFEGVLQAADVFANTYQGTYTSVDAWVRHYFALMGEQKEPGFDFDSYGRAAALKGDVQFIEADGGRIHVFWND